MTNHLPSGNASVTGTGKSGEGKIISICVRPEKVGAHFSPTLIKIVLSSHGRFISLGTLKQNFPRIAKATEHVSRAY